MNAVISVALLLLASATGSVEIERNYHEKIGIPLAERIRAEENTILSGRSVDTLGEDRIVGGVIAPVNAHPYLAGLLISFHNIGGSSACGASILSANRLVTAAHCWFDGVNQASQFVVVMGSNMLFSGGTRIATNQVILHPQWDPQWFTNDVAMIYLPWRVALSASIQAIALPTLADLNNQFIGEWTVAAGFGITSDAQQGVSINQMVSHVSLRVISVPDCSRVFVPGFVRDSNICTSGVGGVGICRGDSGGPLVLHRNGRPTLVGISSFVAQNACQQGHPSAFARVTSFYSFILNHL